MIVLIIWILIFALSLFFLVKASNYFTEASEKIGLFFRIPPFIIGVTIVALGTSLPELISSIFSVIKNSSEIVVGNVIGSNIANILLVLGVAAIFGKKLKTSYGLIHVDLPLLVGSAFLLAAMIWDGVFSLGEAFICLAGIIVYILYTIQTQEKYDSKEIKREIEEKFKKKRKLELKTIVVLVLSIVFIFFGAKYTIEAVINLSKILNIGKDVIAISAVALGTSLPELVVSVTAARKGKAEMAIGNVLGSNIFNTFMVMGVPALIGNILIPKSVLFFSLPVMLIATLLYFFITQDKEITKWEGWMLVLFYIFFIGKLFNII